MEAALPRDGGYYATMLACRVLGHRPHFETEGATMRWSCVRGCGAGGEKTYATAADARRYAAAFNRSDRDDLGRRAPFLGMFPLRIWRAISRGTYAGRRR